MTVIGTLSVMPVGEGDATDEIAAAADVLDEHGIDYEINAMGTVIEAEDVGDLFAAARAAHEAVDAGRVHTVLRIDETAIAHRIRPNGSPRSKKPSDANRRRDRSRGARENVPSEERTRRSRTGEVAGWTIGPSPLVNDRWGIQRPRRSSVPTEPLG